MIPTSANRRARVAMLAGLAAFWLGLALAGRQFPGEFDPRFMTVSNLLSVIHNPAGYRWGVAGALCLGITGLCWTVLGAHSRAIRRILYLGFAFMMLAAALPTAWLFNKGHEWLTVVAFVALCGALVHEWVQRQLHRLSCVHHRRGLAALLATAALSPVIGAAVTQAYLALVRPELPWVTLAWRELGIPLILSFALWEWLTSLVLSVCLAMLCLSPQDHVMT